MNIIKKSIRAIKAKIQANKDIKLADKILKDYLENVKGKKILLVSHILSKHGGSPLTFNRLFYKLLDNGYEPLVLGYNGGDFVEELEQQNIKVILGNVFKDDKEAFCKIADNFEKIIANSVVTNTVAYWRNDAIWWIQEAQNIDNDFMNYMPHLKDALKNSSKIFVVSDYAKEVVEKYNSTCEVIKLGVKDYSKIVTPHTIKDKIKFMTVGEINDCKAQDVLINAIAKLDKKYLEQSEFHLVFERKKGHRFRYVDKIKKQVGNVYYENIEINQEKKSQMFEDMDVFVIPSRDESCSLVTLEACMLSKPVIVSENVGAKYMIKQDENGYIVKTGDIDSLKFAIEKIIDNKNHLDEMGKNSRRMYENFATESLLENSINRIIEYLETEYTLFQ